MMHKAWSSIKEVPYFFQGHTSNCKVTRLKISSNFTQIGRFRTVTPVWIHWWIWNDTQSLMLYRRRALLFFRLIHQISRSHRRKIGDLNPIWVRLLGRSQLSNPSDLPCFLPDRRTGTTIVFIGPPLFSLVEDQGAVDFPMSVVYRRRHQRLLRTMGSWSDKPPLSCLLAVPQPEWIMGKPGPVFYLLS